MVIAIIILSIVATISILANILIISYLKHIFDKIKTFVQISKQLDALNPNFSMDIDEKDCEAIYKDVNLIVTVEKSEVTATSYDISSYEKNNIIGLTYFVQEQDLKEMQQKFLKQIPEAAEMSPQEQQELFTKPEIIPHCDVYHLKDGNWLWSSTLLSFG